MSGDLHDKNADNLQEPENTGNIGVCTVMKRRWKTWLKLSQTLRLRRRLDIRWEMSWPTARSSEPRDLELGVERPLPTP